MGDKKARSIRCFNLCYNNNGFLKFMKSKYKSLYNDSNLSLFEIWLNCLNKSYLKSVYIDYKITNYFK